MKSVGHCYKSGQTIQWNRRKNVEIDIYGQLIFVQKQFSGKTTIVSISGDGAIGYVYEKIITSITIYIKINSKWVIDLNVKPRIIKLLEKNIEEKLFWLWIRQRILR